MRHSSCVSAGRLPIRKGWFLPSKSPVRVKAASMPIASFAPAARHEQHSRDQVCAWWGLPSTCNTERFPLPHLSSNLPPKLRHQQQDNQKTYIPKLFLFCFVLFCFMKPMTFYVATLIFHSSLVRRVLIAKSCFSTVTSTVLAD